MSIDEKEVVEALRRRDHTMITTLAGPIIRAWALHRWECVTCWQGRVCLEGIEPSFNFQEFDQVAKTADVVCEIVDELHPPKVRLRWPDGATLEISLRLAN